jgi:hypothetical protein
MDNWLDTVISQYGNSPTILGIIESFNDAIDPSADIDQFVSVVMDLNTAEGFGLDIWGRIVDVSRTLNVPGAITYLGFNEAYTLATASTGAQPFGQAPFYAGVASTQSYTLTDDAYRTLIFVKALANISNCTAPTLNKLLQRLFNGATQLAPTLGNNFVLGFSTLGVSASRGRCYVVDTGQMQMRFVFEFGLQPFELAILTQSNAVPRPAAVLAQVLQVDIPTTFGFSEAGQYQPFNQGVFFNSTNGLTNAA